MPPPSRVIVVGAGLVGLASGWAISARWPDTTVTILDKEDRIAAHQSGHNSGVIHSGAYYPPGSAKAVMCRDGRRRLLSFVAAHDIAHELCGKVIVAVDDQEVPGLLAIAERARANGVAAELIDAPALRAIEPAVRGVRALRVDDAGIVDFVGVAQRLAEMIVDAGGEVCFGQEVIGAGEDEQGVVVRTSTEERSADLLVTCAGLHSDRLVRQLTGVAPPVTIVPFRGEYHRLRDSAKGLCRGLIYPVPDPRFPFLGVHLTRHISGDVLAGPNAVLAGQREGYSWREVDFGDLRSVAADPGMRALARQHWRTGAEEVWRSLNRRAFAKALRRMTPDLQAADLLPAPAGVRAQAVRPDGSLVDDFVFHSTARGVHVLNAPSPAATASLAIGEKIADRVASLW